MWRSVFMHEFPDASIRNFHALAGSTAPASLALAPVWDAEEERYALRMELDRGFVYTLRQPLPDVIGVSLRARVHFRAGVGPQKYPLFNLGGALSVGLWGGEVDHANGEASIAFWLGTAPAVVLGKVDISMRKPIVYRVDWHTSGQLKVYFDGVLSAYHNAVQPGARFTLDSVAFGMVPFAMPAGQGYTISSVSVKCLQRDTVLRQLNKAFPEVNLPPGTPIRCRSGVTASMLRAADKLRAIMALFHSGASQPWVRGEGSPAAPFTPAALHAHAKALEAGAELATMLRTWDFSRPQPFLDALTRLLQHVRTAQPLAFKQLMAELMATKDLPDTCAIPEDKVDPETRRQFAGLFELMKKIHELTLTIANGA